MDREADTSNSLLEHRIRFRVYYSDTDAGGVVYYANYGHFFERGRTELLHAVGVSPKQLMEKYALLLPVVTFQVDYHRPAYYDEQLLLITRLSEITAVRLTYEYKLMRADSAPESARHNFIVSGKTVNVAVDSHTMRPRRLPRELFTKFK